MRETSPKRDRRTNGNKHDVRDALRRMVVAARPVLEWGDIQEVITAALLEERGTKVELL
jgi:hypothetical protein